MKCKLKTQKVVHNGKVYWQLDARKQVNGVKKGSRYYFQTEDEAIEKRDEIIKNGYFDIDKNSSSLTVRNAMIEFANSSYYWKVKKKKKNKRNTDETIRDRINRYNHYLDAYFGDDTIDSIDTKRMHDLSTYISELTKFDDDEPISGKLMYRIWNDVKAMLHYCSQKGYLKYEIVVKEEDDFACPKYDKPDCWNESEFKEYINAINRDIEKKFFRMQGECGTRLSEGLGLKFKNVDFKKSKIYIETQTKGKHKKDQPLKTEESYREIDASKNVMNDLLELKKDAIKKGLTEEDILEEYCFTNNKGEILARNTLRTHHYEYIKKAGIKRLNIHCLRHYFATTLLRHGKSIPYVQSQLGHSHNDVTIFKHYYSLIEEEKESAVNVFDEIERKGE